MIDSMPARPWWSWDQSSETVGDHARPTRRRERHAAAAHALALRPLGAQRDPRGDDAQHLVQLHCGERGAHAAARAAAERDERVALGCGAIEEALRPERRGVGVELGAAVRE